MREQILDILLCPSCDSALTLTEAESATVQYSDGPSEEVRSGIVTCVGCGRRYPVTNFVLSFAQLFPPDLEREAAYWDRFYMWLLEQGSYGFHDLRQGQAPYITLGVPEPFPAADTLDRYNIHHKVAEHPLVRQGKTMLDIGVGLGWTSLYFARAGYSVTAFEPSLGPVTAAKRYAMEQGVFVEYVCAAMGAIHFRPGSFSNVTAFHSLHHVPNLESELRKVRDWLLPGGALALDEHVGNSKLAAAIGGEVHRWAEAEVLPRYRTIAPGALAGLPQEPHSAMEDTSVDEVAPLVRRLFDVRMDSTRHVFLDHYPLLYYLHTDRNLSAYKHAIEIANQMQEFVRLADPGGGDYITIIAENTGVEHRPSTTPLGELPAHGMSEGAKASIQPDLNKGFALRRVVRRGAATPRPYSTTELESNLSAQGAWARQLEAEVERKNTEIARLERTVKRLEGGLVMRLLHRVTGRGSSKQRR